MMKARKLILAGVIGLATTLTVPAFAQFNGGSDRNDQWGWRQDRDHDGDHDRDDDHWRNGRNKQAYDNGYEEGLRDRRANRNWALRDGRYRDNDDQQAYVAGYRAGYGDAQRDNRGGWGWNGGRNASSAGERMGFQDGLRYGSHDRQVHKPFRPTDSQAYHDADAGYSSAYGSKNLYRSGYRQGYQQGYQRGYYGR